MPGRSCCRQVIRSGLAAMLPRRMFLVRGPADARSVCLTFDDGPHPEYTPRLLDVLKQHGVHGTFFVIGERAKAFPELVRRIAAEGHAVGHHTYFHREPEQVSPRTLLAELRQTDQVLCELLGRRSWLFRPPRGKLTASKLLRLWRARQTIVLWNVDPKDFACQGAEEVCSHFACRPLNPGDLVLMHDNQPFAAEVVGALVPAVRSRGITFATVPDWL